jgi:hypothetical protein
MIVMPPTPVADPITLFLNLLTNLHWLHKSTSLLFRMPLTAITPYLLIPYLVSNTKLSPKLLSGQEEPHEKNAAQTLSQEVTGPSVTPAALDLHSPEYTLNRELTWLEFNKRILSEAADARKPLLERVFFLAVIHSNLAEFYMKRIGGLKQQVGAGVKQLSIDDHRAVAE